jgi:cysteinyl-tRNA synthetase
MHSYWVTMAGEKMSKSLGNTLGVEVLTQSVRPIALRYYLVSVHYRSSIEYSPEALADAARAFDRIEAFLKRAAGHGEVEIASVPDAFAEAMDDDLSVPRALAVVYDAVRAGNSAASAGDWGAAVEQASLVRGMLAVLGLDPFVAPWAGAAGAGDSSRALVDATGALISEFLDERTAARAAKDFATADRIRDRLARAGFGIEDTPDGPVWSVAAASGSSE